ncbi:MAG: hypothetical protein H6949_16975 [Zoogloeaceae bacterium]|nr:hypothetical protein [Zoogloeaceae bacterium]
MGLTFQQRIIALLRDDPSVLQLGYVEKVVIPPRGEPLMPDIVITQGGKSVAIEVKAVTPETSVHTIGGLLARVAQLEQRYTFAALVFPLGADDIAEMARGLQREWDGREPRIVLL